MNAPASQDASAFQTACSWPLGHESTQRCDPSICDILCPTNGASACILVAGNCVNCLLRRAPRDAWRHAWALSHGLLRRWDDCFIRLLDGMLQVVGFTDKALQDNMLKIPTRIRAICIPHPEGSPLPALPCATKRNLGSVSTPLCSIVGLELSAAPRQAEPPNTRCASSTSTAQRSAAQHS